MSDVTVNGASASASDGADCATCILSNTASDYDFHVVVCDRVEDDAFVGALNTALHEYAASGQPGSNKSFKLTCCVYSPLEMPGYDVESMVSFILYPAAKIFAFEPKPEFMPTIASIIYSQAIGDTSFDLASQGILSCPVPWQTLFLVCAHAARDKRCGRAGPQIIQSLEQAIEEACETPLTTSAGIISLQPGQVKILPSSHIGGHKFAGTLIVYPSGHWYGHISKGNSKELLGNVLLESPMPKCFRGKGLHSLDF